MDAISFLKKEHNKIRRMLSQISKSSDELERKSLFDEFCDELLLHETMEHKVWYPALKKRSELQDIIKHLISEEKSAEESIKKFNKVRFELMWTLRFYKLKFDVSHHAKEEEQELFPQVEEFLDETELNALGMKMQKFMDANR